MCHIIIETTVCLFCIIMQHLLPLKKAMEIKVNFFSTGQVCSKVAIQLAKKITHFSASTQDKYFAN